MSLLLIIRSLQPQVHCLPAPSLCSVLSMVWGPLEDARAANCCRACNHPTWLFVCSIAMPTARLISAQGHVFPEALSLPDECRMTCVLDYLHLCILCGMLLATFHTEADAAHYMNPSRACVCESACQSAVNVNQLVAAENTLPSAAQRGCEALQRTVLAEISYHSATAQLPD